MALKTNYKDDIFTGDYRKYRQINNSDGTISLSDVTEYSQTGDKFGASDINATNQAVNQLNSDLTAKVGNFTSGNYKAVTGLAYDSTNKKLGLKVGADSVIPFSGGLDLSYLKSYILNTGYADYFVESTSADTTLETGGYETKRNSNTPVIIFMHYQNGYYYWMMYGLTENSVKVTAIGDYGTALYSTTTSQVNENETIYVAMQASGQRSRGYFNMTNPTKKVSIYPYYTDFVKTIADLLLHIQ